MRSRVCLRSEPAATRSAGGRMAERILIVGGGIAGLTLNRALGDGPYHVELIERDAGTGRHGAGIAVQPNAMRVLQSLGASDAVERAGSIISRLGYRDQDGAMLCEIDLDELWSGVGSFVGITRTALHDALLWRSERCRFGTVVTSVRERGGQVSVSLGDGTSADYDLVVGADGINSDVRGAAVDASEPCYADQMAWRASSSGWARTGSSGCSRLATASRTASAI